MKAAWTAEHVYCIAHPDPEANDPTNAAIVASKPYNVALEIHVQSQRGMSANNHAKALPFVLPGPLSRGSQQHMSMPSQHVLLHSTARAHANADDMNRS